MSVRLGFFSVHILGRCVCVCVCYGQKRVAEPLELELQVVVSSHVVLGPLQEEQVLLTAETSLWPPSSLHRIL